MSQTMASVSRRLRVGQKLAKARRGEKPGAMIFVCGDEVELVKRLTWKSRRNKAMQRKRIAVAPRRKTFRPRPKVIRATKLMCSDAARCNHETLARYSVSSIGQKAPTCPGLYFIYQESRLIYIGQASKDLRGRLTGHEVIRIIGRWESGKPLQFSFIAISDLENLNQVELHFIRTLKPVLNSDPFENIAALNRRRVA